MTCYIITLRPKNKNIVKWQSLMQQHHFTASIESGVIATDKDVKVWLTPYGKETVRTCRHTREHISKVSELGCFLAHRNVWVRCVRQNQPVWIFEDGVVEVNVPLLTEVDKMAQHLRIDLIRASRSQDKSMCPERSNTLGNVIMETPRLYKITGLFFSTKCYRITPQLARSLLTIKTFDLQVDAFVGLHVFYSDSFTMAYAPDLILTGSVGSIGHELVHSATTGISSFFTVVIFAVLVIGSVFYYYKYYTCHKSKKR